MLPNEESFDPLLDDECVNVDFTMLSLLFACGLTVGRGDRREEAAFNARINGGGGGRNEEEEVGM